MNAFRVALVLASLGLLPHLAAAQDLPSAPETDAPADSAEAGYELARIDEQARLATAGYVTSTVLHVAGLGLATVASIAGFCIGDCPDRGTWSAVIGIGAALTIGGLIGIFVSVGLDVDSGNRRTAWRERYGVSDVAFSLTPIEDGALGVLVGRF